MLLTAQWDHFAYMPQSCGLGEHVGAQTLTFLLQAQLIYHTCMAMLL